MLPQVQNKLLRSLIGFIVQFVHVLIIIRLLHMTVYPEPKIQCICKLYIYIGYISNDFIGSIDSIDSQIACSLVRFSQKIVGTGWHRKNVR